MLFHFEGELFLFTDLERCEESFRFFLVINYFDQVQIVTDVEGTAVAVLRRYFEPPLTQWGLLPS